MANSAGGQIIYGIEEKKTRKPTGVDDGVTDDKITREWLHQILGSNIHPRMDGLTIQRIPLSSSGFAFVISIEPTHTGPHQAPDNKYYKRFELHSVPMEDYEIRDIMRHSNSGPPYRVMCRKNCLKQPHPLIRQSEIVWRYFFMPITQGPLIRRSQPGWGRCILSIKRFRTLNLFYRLYQRFEVRRSPTPLKHQQVQ